MQFSLFRITLAFVLSVLPLIVLHLDASNEQQRQKSEMFQSLNNRFRILAEKLSRQTEITYWVEEIGKRVKRELFRNGGKPLETHSGFSSALGQAAAKAGFSELPKANFWGVFFSDLNSRKREPVLHPNLEQCDSVFFEKLLSVAARSRNRAIKKNDDDDDLNVNSGTWQNRIKMNLGRSVSSAFFTEEYRGKAFHVIYKKTSGIMLWDFLFVRGSLRGAMVVFQPLPEEFEIKPLSLALNNWMESSIKPAFLRFPTGVEKSEKFRVQAHKTLVKTVVPRQLSLWGRCLKVIPFDEQTNAPPSIRTGAPFLFQINPIDDNKRWLAYFFPVSPLSGHLGALVCRLPEPPRQFIEELSIQLRLIIVFSWIFFLIYLWFFRRIPQIGIQWQLLFWFIGLMGMPAAVSFGAMVRLSGDIISNRRYELQSDLILETKKLEASEKRINEKLNELLRKNCEDKNLIGILEKMRSQPIEQDKFLTDFYSRLSLRGVAPSALFIFGPKGFHMEKFEPGTSSGYRSILKRVFQRGYENEFSLSEAEGNSDEKDNNSVNLGSFSKDYGETKQTYYSGGKIYSLGRFELLENQVVKFQVAAMWDESPLFHSFIAEAQKESAIRLENRKIELAVFQICGNTLKEISFNQEEKPAYVPLIQQAYLSMKQTFFQHRKDKGDLVFGFPSRRYPGFILMSRVSLESVNDEFYASLYRLLGIWFGLILLGITTIQLLAERITRPVQKMTRSLLQVTQENFQINLAESRRDELGETGNNLQKMISWLEERARVSKFVVPQVLELLGEESYTQALAGVKKNVAVLSSDIRNFTSLTEMYPPREIFSLLNFHMETMTTVIKEEGGYIDRFVGDAIQAVFYEDSRILASQTASSPAFAAVCAAERMMHKHREILLKRSAEELFPYQIGIGIERDMAIAGVLGAEEVRQDFTVIGDIIKKANELEALSKSGNKTNIIVSGNVRNETAKFFEFQKLPGNTEAWELLSLNPMPLKAAEKNRTAEIKINNVQKPDQSRSSSGIAFLLWLIPLIILALTIHPWLKNVALHSEMDITSQVKAVIPTLEARFNPIPQASLFLDDICRRLETAKGESIQSVGNIVDRIFPGAGWYVFSPSTQNEGSFKIIASNPLQMSPFFSSDDLEHLFKLFSMRYLNIPAVDEYILPNELNWIVKRFVLGKRGDARNYGFLSCVFRGLGNLFPINIRSKRMFLFWEPLFTSAGRFSGGFMVFIPGESDPIKAGIDCFFENMKKDGFEVSVRDLSNGKIIKISDNFPASGNGTHKNHGNVENRNGWICAGDIIQRSVPYEILIAKRLPPLNNLTVLLLFFIVVFSITWILAGILLFYYRKLFASEFNLSLQSQMILAFSLVLIPALIVTSILIDQSGREQSRRAVFESRQNFQEDLSNVAEGNRAVLSSANRLFVKESMKFCEKNYLQSEIPPNTVSVPNIRMVQLDNLLNRHGLTFYHLAIVHQNANLAGIGLSDEMLEVGGSIFSRILAGLSKTALFSEETKKTNSKIELLTEELQSFLESINPPEVNSEMYLSPDSITTWGGGGNLPRMFFTRYLLSENGCPKAVIYAQFRGNTLFYHVLNEYASPQNFAISRVKYPGWISSSNYGLFPDPVTWDPAKEEGPKRPPIKELFKPAPHSFRRLAILANETKECIWSLDGEGLEQKLVMAVPERVLEGFLIFGNLTMKEILIPILQRNQLQLLFLIFIGILGLFLAKAVSKQFLTPLLALSQKARAIMNNDFSARLEVQSADEFGELANSFNCMAQGVQEGRILRRFVSESVLHTSASKEEQNLAKDGQSIDAVVLFAKLRDMNQRQSGKSPAELIKDLNSFLSEMSAIICGNRGEIDKFIGEKIMAVFSERRFGSIEAAQSAALNVSQKMRQKIGLIPDFSNDSLAVGVASGKVLSGILGSESVRLEHTVIGDKVNQAARLLEVADKSGGGIVLEDSFLYLCEKNLPESFPWNECKAIGNIHVKGKEKTIQAYHIPPIRQ
ncbi:MAG: HAMP domain-containing protein [Candidatus Riflebacteria bacterium]|nr:HAMP domain-containing protein [Candidatus Riflebacteria bacterium]